MSKKHILRVICVVILTLIFNQKQEALFSTEAYAYKIIIIKSKDLAPYNEVIKGLKKRVAQSKSNIYYAEYNVENSVDYAALLEFQPDVVVTIGTDATLEATYNIKDIPIIFSMTSKTEIVEINRKNMTGVYLDISPNMQLSYFRKLFPKFKNIAVFYNPLENEQIISEIKKVAPDFHFKLKEYPINKFNDIPDLKTEDLDFIWLIPDTVVCRLPILKYIFKNSIINKQPVVAFSKSYVKSGAMFAMTIDYMDIGRQTGNIVVSQLFNSETLNTSPLSPQKVLTFFNMAVSKMLGQRIHDSLIREADEVYNR